MDGEAIPGRKNPLHPLHSLVLVEVPLSGRDRTRLYSGRAQLDCGPSAGGPSQPAPFSVQTGEGADAILLNWEMKCKTDVNVTLWLRLNAPKSGNSKLCFPQQL